MTGRRRRRTAPLRDRRSRGWLSAAGACIVAGRAGPLFPGDGLAHGCKSTTHPRGAHYCDGRKVIRRDAIGRKKVLTRADLDALIGGLAGRGYRVVGPKLRDQAIVYDDIGGVDDLPAGWTDEQDGGRYRLERRDDDALFGYAVGPHSWKKFLHPPRLRLWRAERGETRLRHRSPSRSPITPLRLHRRARLRARTRSRSRTACSSKGAHVDPHYSARREGAFIVAVNCGKAGGTCFCVSMKTGPKAPNRASTSR